MWPVGAGVDHHEVPAGLLHHPGELPEHGHLVGARGQQVLGQRRASFLVQTPALGRHHVAAVFLDGRLRIDPGDGQAVHGAVECLGEVRRGISRGEVHRVAALGQGDGDRGGDRGLPDPALAHAQHEPVAAGFHLVHQRAQRSVLDPGVVGCGDQPRVRRAAGVGRAREQGLQRRDADHVARL